MTKFTKWKKWQKLKSKPHAHLQTIRKTCAKFQKDRYKTVRVALTRYPLSIHFHRTWGQEMTKVREVEKVIKIMQGLYRNHMHIFRPWRKHAKFQKDRYKIVWGDALTRYPLSIHWGKKMTKFTKWKKWQKIISQLYPNHMYNLIPWRKHM